MHLKTSRISGRNLQTAAAMAAASLWQAHEAHGQQPFPIRFPEPWDFSRHWPILVILGFLILAIALEVLRRRRQQTELMRAQWRTIKEMADERELTAREWALLEDCLRRHARKEPLRAVTVYREFDACVKRDIDEFRRNAEAHEVEARGILLRDLRTRLGLDYVPAGQQIQSTRELSAGQIVWATREGALAATWLKMRVSVVHEARFILEAGPGEPVPEFSRGDAVRFRMWREEDARYVFTATLVRVENEPRQWVFDHTGDLKRVQTRAHYRVRYDQAATVALLRTPGEDCSNPASLAPSATLRGRITSLSGGGLAMVLDQPVTEHTLLRVTIELPGEPEFNVHARIVGESPLSLGRHLVRASFVNIEEESAEAIARYVLHREQTRLAEEALGGGHS